MSKWGYSCDGQCGTGWSAANYGRRWHGGVAGRGGAGRGVAMVGQSNTYSPSLEEAAGEEVLQGCEAKSAEGGVTDAA